MTRRRKHAMGQEATPGSFPRTASGFPPAWIARKTEAGTAKFTLIAQRATIIREIFQMCLDGYAPDQIAEVLNKRKVRTFSHNVPWVAARIAMLLRNEAVIGYHRPIVRINGKRKCGERIALYPPAIDEDMWLQTRQILATRRKQLLGPRGGDIANLFTGHAFCSICDHTLRVETLRPGERRLVCSGRRDLLVCNNEARFDLILTESNVLHYLMTLPMGSSDGLGAIKDLICPAIQGNIDARKRLRSLLSRFDYRLEAGVSEMKLTVDGREQIVATEVCGRPGATANTRPKKDENPAPTQ